MGPSEFVEGEAEVIAGVLQIWFGERAAPLFPVVRIETQMTAPKARATVARATEATLPNQRLQPTAAGAIMSRRG